MKKLCSQNPFKWNLKENKIEEQAKRKKIKTWHPLHKSLVPQRKLILLTAAIQLDGEEKKKKKSERKTIV